MSTYSRELEVAKEAVAEASTIIRNFKNKRNFKINFKGRNDLVTDADVEAEKAILEVIAGTFPGDAVMAEETAGLQQMPTGKIWLIDPIDGTTNFTHDFPVFCISIALWENCEPRMGVVYEVNRDELFTAVTGEGAYLNEVEIGVSSVDDPQDAMIGTGFPYNDLSLVDNYLDFFKMLMFNTRAVRRPGAASYDLACVAAGRFDGFYEYALNAWDVAAGSVIIKEAGGVVTDWQGGENWLFGKRIVAGNPAIHHFLLDGIHDHFEKGELEAGG